MTITQAQANAAAKRILPTISELTGVPARTNVTIEVMPAAEYAAKYGGGAVTLAGVTYIPDNIDIDRLEYVLSYELVHSNLNVGGASGIGPNGELTFDSRQTRVAEALAWAIANNLNPDANGKPPAFAKAWVNLLAENPEGFKEAATHFNSTGLIKPPKAYSSAAGDDTPDDRAAASTEAPEDLTADDVVKIIVEQVLAGNIPLTALGDKKKREVITRINENTPGANYGLNSSDKEFMEGVAKYGQVLGVQTGNDVPALADSGIAADFPKLAGLETTDGNSTTVTNEDGSTTTTTTNSDGTQTTETTNQDGSSAGPGVTIDLTTGLQATPKVEQRHNYMSQIQGMQLGMTPDLRALVIEAQRNGWSAAQFEFAVRRTPDYASQYPGIIGPNGQMLMSESSYNEYVRTYTGIAGQNGIAITRNDIAHLISSNVSPAEFDTRTNAIQRIESNKVVFKQFNATLVAQGMKPLDEKGIQAFVMGESSPEFYDVWNKAAAAAAAVNAGVKIGGEGYAGMNREQIDKVAGLGLTEAELKSGFGEVAQRLLTLIPASQIQGAGLTSADIRQSVFGGPKQAKIQQKITRLLETAQAATQETAHTQVTPTQAGGLQTVGSNQQRAGSAY